VDHEAAISSVRFWGVLRRFFLLAAQGIEADHPPLAEKLRRASPHWMRHTHATHALGRGAELPPRGTICDTRRCRRRRSICTVTR
jgi:hypothetical protein